MNDEVKKTSISEREEKILKFWQENKIFEKSLAKPAPKGNFIFYEGPPTANGKPGIHHLEARAFKDAVPRYKTMRGFHVRRKAGWDTHGLPVEIAVEKELNLKSKKEIESYGIAAFNQKCRESVWKYIDEWRAFTERIGFWVDQNNPFVTYAASYIESLWAIFKKVDERGLLYKDYKVVPWCPRCGTALSSHELAQGYETVKDLVVTVKFKIQNPKGKSESQNLKFPDNTYLLAWTTTPWTLPGNVALAVHPDIKYSLIELQHMRYIVGNDRLKSVAKDDPYTILQSFSGKELVGLEYEPLYPFLSENLPDEEKGKLAKAFKVYAADFVTTEEGTGIVHTAVMYGQDDFELGTKVGLPKYHLVNEDGTFKKEAGFLAGKFVRDEATAVDIIRDLAGRDLLFAKEKYEHSYPSCWRCHTPLIYFARDSWYIKMSALRGKLIKENEKINWEPAHIKEGRFGEWLSEVKDWAISRERFWGTPLPVWQCESCGKRVVVGSFDEILRGAPGMLTKIILVRHGESEKNLKGIFSHVYEGYPLTAEGVKEARETAKRLAGEDPAAIYASPVTRSKQTAEIIGKVCKKEIIIDDRLREVDSGSWNECKIDDPRVLAEQKTYKSLPAEEFYRAPMGGAGESWQSVEGRIVNFLRDVIAAHRGKTVCVVSHEGPLAFLIRYLEDLPVADMRGSLRKTLMNGYANPRTLFVDNTTGKEFNPHRPRIDDVTLTCACGGAQKRVKEVVDVWFDSGAMPFAEDADKYGPRAYKSKNFLYPADFISEAIDQTRGWFYTLHAVGILMEKGKAYKNVICLGHILDAQGKKMSKSLGNVIMPLPMIEKYGADALRLWMYSVNQPGESKNFEEKAVDEIVKKVFNLADNVLAFYLLYYSPSLLKAKSYKLKATHVLDRWILARLDELIALVTEGLDNYRLFEPVRAIRDFIADLSQWYIRRSRDRFKGDDEENKMQALATTRHVLLTLAKLLAPFAPFFAEYLHQSLHGEEESVHLDNWPNPGRVDNDVLTGMKFIRSFASMALMQRADGKIKVRQPLQKLSIKHKGGVLSKYWDELAEILKDEVNVKEVVLDDTVGQDGPPVKLDLAVTPTLKEEGRVREFIRAVQEFRKKINLTPSDSIALSVETDDKGRAFVESRKEAFAKATLISSFVFEPVAGGESISVDEFSFRVVRKD